MAALGAALDRPIAGPASRRGVDAAPPLGGLLYCIGAQKSATTWFDGWCRTHPQIGTTPLKELHYFNLKLVTGERSHAARLREKFRAVSERIVAAGSKAELADYDVIEATVAMLRAYRSPADDDGPYVDFMRRWSDPAMRYTADVTPGYATLDREGFARMAALSSDPRFVFVMRDPLDRLWSAARMSARQLGRADIDRPALEIFVERLDAGLDERTRQRCDYGRTMRELEAAVPPERLFYDFFETVVSREGTERLSRFLGLDSHLGDLDRVLNGSGGSSPALPVEVEDRALALLAPVYRACAERFGERLPDRWRQRLDRLDGLSGADRAMATVSP